MAARGDTFNALIYVENVLKAVDAGIYPSESQHIPPLAIMERAYEDIANESDDEEFGDRPHKVWDSDKAHGFEGVHHSENNRHEMQVQDTQPTDEIWDGGELLDFKASLDNEAEHQNELQQKRTEELDDADLDSVSVFSMATTVTSTVSILPGSIPTRRHLREALRALAPRLNWTQLQIVLHAIEFDVNYLVLAELENLVQKFCCKPDLIAARCLSCDTQICVVSSS